MFPAASISWLAIHLKLSHVPSYRLPALDLSSIFVRKPPTVPLEPAARINRMYPALLAPHRERLACVNAKQVQRGGRTTMLVAPSSAGRVSTHQRFCEMPAE